MILEPSHKKSSFNSLTSFPIVEMENLMKQPSKKTNFQLVWQSNMFIPCDFFLGKGG